MERVATARLIEAAATLDPASRALLNMWLHRALPDAELARMAGLEPAAVTARKLDIIEHLSEQLRLPPYEIVAALGTITREPAAAPVHANGAPPKQPPPRRQAHATAESRVPPLPAVRLRRGRSALGHLTGTTRLDSRARRRALEFLIPTLMVAAILLVTLLPQGGGADSRDVPPGARRPGLPARADAGRRVAAPRSSVRRARADPPPARLAPIPGLRGGAGGRVQVLTRGGRRMLLVAVRGLPTAAGGRYVAWLYTTVIDSAPLGPLPATGSAMLRLPPDAARFDWIDVSFQPAGDTLDSGESVLRSPNPLRRTSTGGRATG